MLHNAKSVRKLVDIDLRCLDDGLRPLHIWRDTVESLMGRSS